MTGRYVIESPLSGPSSDSDSELIGRILEGDRELYAILVRRYQVRLFRHALGLVMDRDIAADLVQDAYVRAFESLHRCRDRSRFGTWLYRILRNRCLDHLKERRRKDSSLNDHPDMPSRDPDPESSMADRETREILGRALTRLPPPQREAFVLKHVEDLSYEEMATLVGASASTLRMRVMRARESLRLQPPSGSILAPTVTKDRDRRSTAEGGGHSFRKPCRQPSPSLAHPRRASAPLLYTDDNVPLKSG
jgi:RNA polymerase sigma-70 factor, ECF subfamily